MKKAHNIKLLQLHSLPAHEISAFYDTDMLNMESADFHKQLSTIIDNTLSVGDIVTPYMKEFGYRSELVITNNWRSQYQWLAEHGARGIQSSGESSEIARQQVVRQQIDYYRPDILYVTDSHYINDEFITSLGHRPRLVIGRLEPNIENISNLAYFDILLYASRCSLESDLGFESQVLEKSLLGFPLEIWNRVKSVKKSNDVIFQNFPERSYQPATNSLIEEIGGWFSSEFQAFTAQFQLNNSSNPLHYAMRPKIYGRSYGIEAFQAAAASHILVDLNGEVSNSPGQFASSGSRRVYESITPLIQGTGCGALVITRYQEVLEEYFVPGREFISYHSLTDLRKKLDFYLRHPEKCQEIAMQGKARCHSEYSMKEQAKKLDRMIREHLLVNQNLETESQIAFSFSQNPLSKFFESFDSRDHAAMKDSLRQLQALDCPPNTIDFGFALTAMVDGSVEEARMHSERCHRTSAYHAKGTQLLSETSHYGDGSPCSPQGREKPDASIHNLIDSALNSLKFGDTDAAFRKIIEAKSMQEPVADLDHVRALCFLASGNKRAALMSLQEELMLFPNNRGAKILYEELRAELQNAESLDVSDPEFQEIYRMVKPNTMLPTPRLYSLYLLARQVCESDIPGNFVECGVAGGGSSALLCTIIRRYSKRPRLLYACDSYEGMPAPGAHDKAVGIAAQETGWGMGTCAAPEDRVREVCARIGVADLLVTVKGYFEETLKAKKYAIGGISFMHIDCDFYESTKVVLNTLFDSVVPGALVQIDDYGYWEGMEKAVKEFEATRGQSFQIQSIDGHSAWFQNNAL